MVAGLQLADHRHTIKIKLTSSTAKEVYPERQTQKQPQKTIPIIVPENPPTEPFIKSKYSSFQLIPHTNVKNDKVSQFSEVIADTYQELFQRLKGKEFSDPDRIFFETEIKKDSFRTYVATNSELNETIKQHVRMVWKEVTMSNNPKEEYMELVPASLGYEFKLKHPFFLSLKTDRRMQEVPLPELLEVSRTMLEGEKVFIQFGFQAAENDWFKDGEEQKETYEKKPPKRWKKKELSKSTEFKLGEAGFDFCLRVIVSSNDERRKKRISRGIILALKQLNQDNELQEKQIKPSAMKRFIEDMKQRRIKVPFLFGKRQILSSAEIAHFVKLPQRSLQNEYPIIEMIAGKEIKIPETLKMSGIQLGSATFRGKAQQIFMPTHNFDELCLPRIAIGGMGSGKTKGFGANWIVQSVNNNFGALAIDPAKGEIGNEVEASLPADKVIRIKLGASLIALDWCEVKYSSRAKNRLANTVLGFFNTATDEAGAQTGRYIRAAVMGMKTGKLSEIMRILEDDNYRTELLKEMDGKLNHLHKATLEDLNKMSEGKKAQILAPIYNRLDTILGDEYLAECMESNVSIDMVDLMSQRKAIIIDVPKAELGPEAVDLIVNLLSTKIDLAMTLRNEQNQFPFFVVFDEPHQFLRSAKTWKSAVVESRKWRVGYVWMFHSWEQIPKDLAEIIKAAGPHYHLYPSSKKTFNDLKEEIAPFAIEEALSLKRFHAINIIRTGGEVIKPFIAKMAAPPSFKIN
ncbi:hypothetical protein AWM68_20645 [Fictibacillus phosphorivorans]|uniref:ATP-binding protein n=1 Tax=Fictibacillus phosphorivorans TaxID=1221500 RepID=A0A163QSQ1_9BACL|nr:hypothetical protein [Fictibacillus phosphorivorans]KZE65613.1 hypothetical protein AWM68_20645 [Fictibacillus phosphorivorans]